MFSAAHANGGRVALPLGSREHPFDLGFSVTTG
jgi:hypothetical protein